MAKLNFQFSIFHFQLPKATACVLFHQEIRGEANQRGGYTDIGHVFVTGVPLREKPENKQPQ